MVNIMEKEKSFAEMSDEQFYSYLKEKYGERWVLCPLTSEELERVPSLSEEEICYALEQGQKDYAAVKAAAPSIHHQIKKIFHI